MADLIPVDALSGTAAGPMLAMIVGAGMIIVAVLLLLLLATYVYTSIAMMITAKRLKAKSPWLAWIPIGNLVLMSRMAKMHWWPVLLIVGMIIPFINVLCSIAFMVFVIVWTWKICEARNKPGWFSLLVFIPIVGWIWGLVLWGLLAWSD